MAIPSRQIGWGTEENLLWQISKQLEYLTGVTYKSLSELAPTYKVYTALLTQSGGDNPSDIMNSPLTIGVTYTINNYNPSYTLGDFTNVGAPNNNIGTPFVATGTTPNDWGSGIVLVYNEGTPVVTVLENTIGNIWFTYDDVGFYYVKSNGLFIDNKTAVFIGPLDLNASTPIVQTDHSSNDSSTYFIVTSDTNGNGANGMLFNTPIEIRVYN